MCARGAHPARSSGPSTSPLDRMRAQLAILFGLVAGVVAWSMLKGKTDVETLSAGGIFGANLAFGIYALVVGEISLGGRGGRNPRRYSGWRARAIGLAWFSFTLTIAGFWSHAV